MVIGVSSFFRDAAVYDQIAFNVLPSLLRTGSPAREAVAEVTALLGSPSPATASPWSSARSAWP